MPAHLPRPNRPMTRLRSIVDDAQPCVGPDQLFPGKDAARWSAGVPELEGVAVLCSDARVGATTKLAGRWIDPGATAGTLAFLQYTSGSTATPKGVMITHGNLLDNSARIQAAFGSCPDGRGVFWLPLFHDMGLIGGVLQTLYCGGSSTLFSPVSFLQRPLRWLASDFSAPARRSAEGPTSPTTSASRRRRPSSARRSTSAAGGSRSTAPSRSAPRRSTASPRPSPRPASGARRSCPATAWPRRRCSSPAIPRAARPSCSRPTPSRSGEARSPRRAPAGPRRAGQQRPCRRGPRGRDRRPRHRQPVPRGCVGEIWVAGPSVAQGTGTAPRRAGKSWAPAWPGRTTAPFLRTGDLGFLHDGELFVTGRIKDMIILRGRNVYPQDVEWAAERCHPALRRAEPPRSRSRPTGEERLASSSRSSGGPEGCGRGDLRGGPPRGRRWRSTSRSSRSG